MHGGAKVEGSEVRFVLNNAPTHFITRSFLKIRLDRVRTEGSISVTTECGALVHGGAKVDTSEVRVLEGFEHLARAP